MFSQTPYSTALTAIGVRQANLETALRIAAIMAEASERLSRLQSDAANAAFAENSKHLSAMLNTLETTDSAALLAEWTRLYQANVRRVLDLTRSCFEIVPKAQAEIAKLMGDPLAIANGQTQLCLDEFTKAINDSRDAAAASMKNALANTPRGDGKPGTDVAAPAQQNAS